MDGFEANRAYFDLKMEGKLDNPDQRICEDAASFVRNSVEIIALIGSKFLNICAFTGVLWLVSPTRFTFASLQRTERMGKACHLILFNCSL